MIPGILPARYLGVFAPVYRCARCDAKFRMPPRHSSSPTGKAVGETESHECGLGKIGLARLVGADLLRAGD